MSIESASVPAWTLGRLARWPFAGSHGPRAGWRALAFLGLFIVGSEAIEGLLPQAGGELHAVPLLLRETLLLLLVLGSTQQLGLLEGRTLGDYGLPLRGAPGRQFGGGLALGLAANTALVVLLTVAGSLSLGVTALSPGTVLVSGASWAAVFLVVGLFEELLLRGYLQATLARGLGFWPAACLLSGLFAAMHRNNPGETPLGLAAVGCFGLFFCYTLRRTGDLWLAVGFHASWDWSESFLYGVPNSGTLVAGHLLGASCSGPAWLSGGSAGPEGSVLVLVTLAAAGLVVALGVSRKPPAG